jgi:hypothetical protein
MFLVRLHLVGSSYLSPVVVALEIVAWVNVVWLKLVLWLSCLNHVFGDKLHFVWQVDPGSLPGLSQSHTPLSAVFAPCLRLVCARFAPGLWRFILSDVWTTWRQNINTKARHRISYVCCLIILYSCSSFVRTLYCLCWTKRTQGLHKQQRPFV